MGLLLIYIGTVIGSVVIKAKNILDIFKDIADEGYKPNFENINKNRPSEEFIQRRNISNLIPIYNIFKALNERLAYKFTRESFLENLKYDKTFEPLEHLEVLEYLNNPTGLNAILVPIRFKNRLEKADLLEIKSGPVTGNVYYEMPDDVDEIIILKATGEIANLSKEEQENIVLSYWEDSFGELVNKFGSLDKIFEELEKRTDIELLIENDVDTNKDITCEYGTYHDEQLNEEISEEKGPSLRRKR